MTSLHDGFSTNEFEPVAAHFRGFRAFVVDDSEEGPDPSGFVGGHDKVVLTKMRGVLRGIFKREYRWGPGVNTAVCLAPTSWFGQQMAKPLPPHTRIIPECDCGFWAYTNGDHYLAVNGPAALGVVEGWGRMIVGPDGFRAEKARIVALCFPEAVMTDSPDDTPAHTAASITTGSLAWLVFGWINGVLDSIAARLAVATGSPPPAAATLKRQSGKPWQAVTPDLKAAVLALYPDVPVFDSVADMQRAFPLSDLSAFVHDDKEDEA